MGIAKRQRFVSLHLAWMLAAALSLVLLDSLTYEIFFIVSLIGFLAVVELTSPIRVVPAWRRRLRWVMILGIIWFGVILFRTFVQLFPSEVL